MIYFLEIFNLSRVICLLTSDSHHHD